MSDGNSLYLAFKTDLLEVFHNKCAFCEQQLTLENIDVLRFRPQRDAVREAGDAPSPPHYFWLAWEWSNIFPACVACAAQKGQQFPIGREKRIGIGVGLRANGLSKSLRAEIPLLLNPCEDEPDKHLIFDERSGMVAANNDSIKGETTIAVFRFNTRPELISQRQEAIKELRGRSFPPPPYPADERILDEWIISTIASTESFAGMKRQLLKKWIVGGITSIGEIRLDEFLRRLAEEVESSRAAVPSAELPDEYKKVFEELKTFLEDWKERKLIEREDLEELIKPLQESKSSVAVKLTTSPPFFTIESPAIVRADLRPILEVIKKLMAKLRE